MDCIDCARTVEKGVRGLDGVQGVVVDFMSGVITLEGVIDQSALAQRLKDLGYELLADKPTSSDSPPAQPPAGGALSGRFDFARYLWGEQNTRLAVIGGGLLLLGIAVGLSGVSPAVSDGLLLAAVGVAGLPIARSGISVLRINHDFTINLLMTIAAVGAVLIGELAEAATVIFLFAVGEALEGYTIDKARQSIRALMALTPPTAIRLRGGGETVVPVEALAVEDLILVKPGERIAIDGEVVRGESAVDQSPITGESMPVLKQPSGEVYAGSVNGMGALEVRVTRLAADSAISRIIHLVEQAQSVRAPSQRAVDQFARYYTPAVVIVAALAALVPPLLFDAPFADLPDGTHGWLYRALSLLVIACPCALVISTPVTVISAITRAARGGVLIKGGAHLERLAQVKAVAFDKTGTLTQGKPAVTRAVALDCDPSVERCPACDDLLALAHAVERRSTHPLAHAVQDAALARAVADRYAPAGAVETLAGRGVRGVVEGRLVTVGSHALFDSDFPHEAALCQQVRDVEAGGETAMLVDDGGRLRGFISAADLPRPESAQTVADLRALGVRSLMLTGDHRAAAEVIGAAVGVDALYADLLPGDKARIVGEIERQHGATLMVGDGINDTPAMAAAAVSAAMGATGSAQALETADIAIMGSDLAHLPFALRLARFARSLIRQNIAISFAVKLGFLALALTGATSLWLAVFADVGTSLLVTLNGTRARRFDGQPG
ncbi:MAG: heavy metal translocating P-type ATPase [Anaerolineae bacterium]|nr:heavy metal translocating P-type ATPase [Anaerolineae bacterium]